MKTKIGSYKLPIKLVVVAAFCLGCLFGLLVILGFNNWWFPYSITTKELMALPSIYAIPSPW